MTTQQKGRRKVLIVAEQAGMRPRDGASGGQGRPETFDFLGFTHCCGINLQGKFQVVRVTAKKRIRAALTAIRDKL